MTLTSTAEQAAIVDASRTGEGLVIEAGAGTGKTSTLRLLAAAKPHERGLYLAYNRAIKDDAQTSFPSNVTCMTAHGLAFRQVGSRYQHRLNGPRVPAREAAQILGVRDSVTIGERKLPPKILTRLAMDTITRWCYSAHAEVGAEHVPQLAGVSEPLDEFHHGPQHQQLIEAVLPIAQAAWQDIAREGGRLKFQHDHYLKMWQLTRPVLNFDYVLFDEAQDANPVIADVVWIQQWSQKILVGDRCQAIYGWRGAIDAMQHFDGQRHQLTQSFRFGPAIAEEANYWLELLNSDLRLTGFDQIDSRIGFLERPAAVLCRSNAQAIAELTFALERGQAAALVGGGGELRRLAEAAQGLQEGRGTDHPDLMAFANWQAVRDYIDEEEAAADLKVLVRIVDRYGTRQLMKMVDALVGEDRADVVVSTAHKAKGREWDTVRIADDFDPGDRTPDRGALMLTYVAVTRARQQLDRTALAGLQEMTEGFDDDQGGDPATDDGEDPTVTGPRESQLMNDVRTCPTCGCTDLDACDGGCSWVDGSELCSACIKAGIRPVIVVDLPPAPDPDHSPQLTAMVRERAEAERQYVRCQHRHAPRPPDPIECPACALKKQPAGAA